MLLSMVTLAAGRLLTAQVEDGSTSDEYRRTLLALEHYRVLASEDDGEILPATKMDARRIIRANVTGPICENTDMLGKDRRLPALVAGDLLAILNAGAYGYAMASRFNSRPMPAEVLIEEGQARLVREREKPEDLLRGQAIPAVSR